MNGFYGEHSHSLDAKGRLIIPQEFREILGDSFMLAKNADHCLCIYSNEEWSTLVQKLEEIPDISDQDIRRFKRFVFGGCCRCELDKQGRFLIPSALREFASLEKDVVLAGVGQRVEVWSKEAWDDVNGEDDFQELAASMAKYGI